MFWLHISSPLRHRMHCLDGNGVQHTSLMTELGMCASYLYTFNCPNTVPNISFSGLNHYFILCSIA